MTHVSSSALNRRGTACALEAEPDWRTSNGVARDCFGGDITAANEAALRSAHEFAGVEFHPREWRSRRAPAKAAKAEAVRTGELFAKRTQSCQSRSGENRRRFCETNPIF